MVLGLAGIQETWSAYESEPGYGHQDWDDDDDYSDGEVDPEEYELEELIDSSFGLTRWTGPAGTWAEDISLTVGDAEVCATTRSADLQPYASEYAGYMSNYGNTMDRWYRRAALVVWPRDRNFTNRAEASPAWALDELRARVRAGDPSGARAAAATLTPFWDTAARAQDQAGFFGKALRTAHRLLNLSWDSLSETIRHLLAAGSPSHRDRRLRLPGRRLGRTAPGPVSPSATCRRRLVDRTARRRVHSRVDTAELPVRHETRRKGRPYTFVLTKSQALF